MQHSRQDQPPSGEPKPPSGEPQHHSTHRHQPTEAELKSARRFIRLFLLFTVLALLASAFPLPWKLMALLCGITALVLGIMALVKSVRARFPRMLRVGLAIGLGVALVITVATAALVAVWPVTAEYETCMSQALTQRAEADCQQIYQDKLQELGGTLTE